MKRVKSVSTIQPDADEIPDIKEAPDSPPPAKKKYHKAGYLPEIRKLKKITVQGDKDYTVTKLIGEGVFGLVFEVVHKDRPFAMKVFKSGIPCAEEIFKKEVAILLETTEISHENVLQLIRTHTIVSPPSQLTEMAILTELFGPSIYDVQVSALKNRDCNTSTFPIPAIRNIGQQILKGMCHLETLYIHHLDLKPENVYFYTKGFVVEEQESQNCAKNPLKLAVIHKDDLRIRIGDFGSANQHLPEHIPPANLTVQMPNYRAPEIFMGLPYTRKSDVWSFGCMLSEMYTGQPLFYGSNSYDTESVQFEMIQKVMRDAPSVRMWKEAFNGGGGTKVKSSNYGYQFAQIPHNSNPALPLFSNVRLDDSAALQLYKTIHKILVFDPKKRMTFFEVSGLQFFL